VGDDVFGRGQNTQAEYAVLDAWAAKPPSIDWAVAAAAGVAGETSPKLLGGGMSPTALTWAFASSVAKSSGYMADQRKRDHGIWSWSRVFCTEKPCPDQCSCRSE
jgi:NADPH:quinone reductase-like Zn-dependent oxidoreductase